MSDNLRNDIFEYVADGGVLASAFMQEYAPRHNAVPATEIQRLLNEEKALRDDVREFVKAGGVDSFSFAVASQPRHGRIPGKVIQRIINDEIELIRDKTCDEMFMVHRASEGIDDIKTFYNRQDAENYFDRKSIEIGEMALLKVLKFKNTAGGVDL